MNDRKDEIENKGESEAENSEHAHVYGHEHLHKTGTFDWLKLLRVFLFRVPLWLVASVLVVVLGWMGWSEFKEVEPANLRPAITDAKRVQIVITTCNDKIDAAGFDIRKEETRLEKKFQDVEKVGEASVLIQRDKENCSADNESTSK